MAGLGLCVRVRVRVRVSYPGELALGSLGYRSNCVFMSLGYASEGSDHSASQQTGVPNTTETLLDRELTPFSPNLLLKHILFSNLPPLPSLLGVRRLKWLE